MNLKDRAKAIKNDLPALFLAIRKRETPWYVKALAAITVGYALSPIDIIPDFIPVIGYLDDLIIVPALIALTIKLIPSEILIQCRNEAKTIWTKGKPKKWHFALPIILIWAIVIFLIIKAIWF